MILPKALLIDLFSLIKVWAVGFFGLHISGVIHILPLVAVSAFLFSFLYKRSLIR